MAEVRERPARSSPVHPAPVWRGAGRVAAGLLAGALVAACAPAPTAAPVSVAPASPTAATATGSPEPAATGSAAPSPGDTGPGVAACSAADLKASHGLVEGTAGSRETEVVLVTAVRCAVPAWPTFGLRDAGDSEAPVLAAAGGSGQIVVEPEGSYASAVQLSNWCGPEPDWPIALELRLDGEAVAVTGGSFPEVGDLPPCSGSGLPTLTATAWSPSS
ncbi:MAG TPA: hypothetical protein VK831_02995 [Candidatus Deferrimicrobiaceae bacterium]|nr:hypothetical protein [Candidatus Deferrimicrobiaceae bacterium]